jgi:hypothetical protein
MRSLHLYTGLFLVPWMAVYATSAFCLNHGERASELLGVTPPSWKVVREVDFAPGDSFPETPAEQAAAILDVLDLDGPHRIVGNPTAAPMTILRICASGNYRIVWRPQQSRIVVEQQQPFSAYRLMHSLHFRGGYQQNYVGAIAWAVMVDSVALCLWFWIVSGIYIWARRPQNHLLGGVCVVAGSLLFGGIVALLCS